ncbi:MAG: hypothetical protein WC829_02355 [Hyphomicrobium sp.]|jgi:hypothetical protein
MADLTVTAASCVPGADARLETGTAGETITAGMPVYKASTGLWMKADSNSATALARQATGIAMTGSSLNQPIVVQKSGSLTLGATMTAGVAYYLSDTAGGICPVADVGAGEYVDIIGIATSATVLKLSFSYSAVSL